jgi:hypothetical protein
MAAEGLVVDDLAGAGFFEPLSGGTIGLDFGHSFFSFLDDFVKGPISALRFVSLSLRRTESTPRATRFARLDLGPFTKSSELIS